MTVAGVAALAGAGRWSGLSSRYDAPSGDAASGDAAGGDAAAPEQAARRSRESAWEQLSRGEDPTAGTGRNEEPPRS
jgi:hypothetical protein